MDKQLEEYFEDWWQEGDVVEENELDNKGRPLHEVNILQSARSLFRMAFLAGVEAANSIEKEGEW